MACKQRKRRWRHRSMKISRGQSVQSGTCAQRFSDASKQPPLHYWEAGARHSRLYQAWTLPACLIASPEFDRLRAGCAVWTRCFTADQHTSCLTHLGQAVRYFLWKRLLEESMVSLPPWRSAQDLRWSAKFSNTFQNRMIRPAGPGFGHSV